VTLPSLRACLFAVAGAAAAVAALVRAQPAASAERGKLIYTRGESPSGDALTVTLELFGDATRRVPGSRYACSNCHGPEGRPQTEAGIAVPDIRPAQLAAAARAGGTLRRMRKAYDAAAIGRAVRMGIDASDNRLHAMMPRFDLSDRDLRDLLAYLAVLGSEAVPGVTAAEVAIATAVPDDEQGRAMLATLQAFAADTNAHGGIYGRQLRVEAVAPQVLAAQAADPAASARWFAVVGATRTAVPAAPALPVVGAITGAAAIEPPLQPLVFWLSPSQATQLAVAVDHWCAAADGGAATFSLCAPPDIAGALARELAPQFARHPAARLVAPGTAADVVLLAGDPQWQGAALPAQLGRSDVAAVYATHALPDSVLAQLSPASRKRLRLLLPVPLPDAADPAVAAFRAFLARHALPETQLGARVAAYAAFATFAEAQKRCGVALTRERLLAELGALQQFRPGLFAPLSFDASHRVGARGAQVAGFDDAGVLQPLAPWTAVR